MLEKLEEPFGATSFEEIKEFEARRGITLPTEYKQFLLQSNGGRPVPDTFDVPGWAYQSSGMQAFFGIQTGNSYDLARELDVYDERIPPDLVPIGCDSFGNVVCIGWKGERLGKIYFWDHENELDENGISRLDYANVYFVANSLQEFLDGLKELEDD